MEGAYSESDFCGGTSRAYVNMPNIDEELVKELYAQKNKAKGGAKELKPTERQKQILMDLWNKCDHRKVAKALGVSTNVALRWYRELTNV